VSTSAEWSACLLQTKEMEELKDIDRPQAQLAYTIIQSLLKGHEALSDLLVVMSHAMDEDLIKAMTNTGEWESYLDSKRELESTKKQIEEFTEQLRKLEEADQGVQS